jgi:hypothetical protein
VEISLPSSLLATRHFSLSGGFCDGVSAFVSFAYPPFERIRKIEEEDDVEEDVDGDKIRGRKYARRNYRGFWTLRRLSPPRLNAIPIVERKFSSCLFLLPSEEKGFLRTWKSGHARN